MKAPMKPRLKSLYEDTLRDTLIKQFNYANVMQVPKLEKIVINMGVGEAVADKKRLQTAMEELKLISSQRPVATAARNSNAGFKIREGMMIGTKVTLRKRRMYEFLDRLVTIAMPRIRDFRGVSRKAFDGRGNYAMGIKEQIIFPEIDYDRVDTIRGMNIVMVTTAPTNAEAMALLEGFGVPFHKS